MLPPFSVFLDQQSDAVYRLLWGSVGPGEVDDCFQETFMAALRAYPRLEPGSNLRAWVLRIAERKALDSHRKRRRSPHPRAELPDASDASHDHTLEPELWSAVRKLPPKQRAAIVHRFVNDLPYAEIGAAIGCSEEAARQNVKAGLDKLRKEWSRAEHRASAH